jgi:hypothetical protein
MKWPFEFMKKYQSGTDLRSQTLMRLESLSSRGFDCASCGETHFGMLDLALDRPIGWPDELEKYEIHRNGDFLLTDDLCVMHGNEFYVRGVIELPIKHAEEHSFRYGVWSSLSQENFKIYKDNFDLNQCDHLGPWFGWFSNELKGYPKTLHLKVKVFPQNERSRPSFALEPTDHPLAVEQREGIEIDRILEVFRANGHDLQL